MSWNVRGLGDSDKCITVRDAILAASPTVVCLQESKLEDISSFKAKAFLPFKIATTFHFAPSSGARGGMVTAWDQSALTPTNKIEKAYTLTTTFSS
jgi:exonuclease III